MFFVQGSRFQGFEMPSTHSHSFPYKAFFKAFCINKGSRAAARLLLKVSFDGTTHWRSGLRNFDARRGRNSMSERQDFPAAMLRRAQYGTLTFENVRQCFRAARAVTATLDSLARETRKNADDRA